MMDFKFIYVKTFSLNILYKKKRKNRKNLRKDTIILIKILIEKPGLCDKTKLFCSYYFKI